MIDWSTKVSRNAGSRRFGVIGGLGSLGGADIFFKLVKSSPALDGRNQCDIIFEQHPFDEGRLAGGSEANANARKIYVFDMIRNFEQRKVDAVILPCFISHTFLEELKPEIRLPVVNIMEALRAHVERRYPEVKKIGVLTSDYVRKHGLFERYFDASRWQLIYPSPEVQRDALMPAIYGERGIKSGCLQGESVEFLERACRDLMAQGAEVIAPGFTEIPIVVDSLCERGLPVIDINQVYARHAVDFGGELSARPFKIGVVGGVGPAATVDFMDKIVRNTQARHDQEHIKVVVEQNPQIPDRTENLIGEGADPTVALYATCKKLEADEADLIAIPCNTAHAFVERIQPYLSIPIINMLYETVDYIRRNHAGRSRIGLLATSGTQQSRVYHDIVEKAGLTLLAPDAVHQAKVMSAIYGEKGVKAGFTEGECRDDLMAALTHLVELGAEIVILGCTELPLLLAQSDNFAVAGKHIVVLDPTEILARKCVSLATR
jgi:aspartate racemase